MRAFRLTAPATTVVSVVELREHVRFPDVTADVSLATYLVAAQERVEVLTGVSLSPQSWRGVLSGFPATAIELAPGPVTAVTAFDFDSAAGGPAQTVDPALYRVVGFSDPVGAVLERVGTWPAVRAGAGSVRLTWTTGFVTGTCPETLRQAVRMLAAHWFRLREMGVIGAMPAEVPEGVRDIAADWRRSWFGA